MYEVNLNGMDKFYKNIGEKVRKIRKKKNISQEELAWKIGKSPNFIGLIERGKKRPSIETLREISRVLGVPLKTFFDDMQYSLPEEDIFIEKIRFLLRNTSEKDKKVVYQVIKSILKKE